MQPGDGRPSVPDRTPSAAQGQVELEQRVLNTMDAPWRNRDGLRNMGNLARKAGVTTSELRCTLNKLGREGSYFPPRG